MDMKEKIKSVVTDTIDFFIDSELTEWPPGCAGILCQPERPNEEKNRNEKSS